MPAALPAPAKVRLFAIRWTAVAETTAFLLGLWILSWLIGNDVRFADISPHPFWMVVLLMAVFYGAPEGLFAAAAATAVFFIGNVPVQFYGEAFSAWLLRITMEPALWFVAAITLGSRADAQRAMLAEQADALRHSREKMALTLSAFNDASEANRQLEQSLAGTARTISTVFEASSLLEDPSEALSPARATAFLQKLLGGGEYEIHLAGEHKQLFGTDSQVCADDALYKVSFEQERFVCVWDPMDRLVLNGRGVMAGPLIGEDGERIGLVIATGLDLERVNSAGFYDFQVACRWLGKAFAAKGQGHLSLHSGRQMVNDLDLLSGLAERFSFPISAIYFQVEVADLNKARKSTLFADALDALRLDVELWYLYPEKGWDFVLLLPGETERTSRALSKKFQEALEGSSDQPVTVTYHVEGLVDQPQPLKVVANDR